MYRKWRRGKNSRLEYIEKKKYREYLEERRREHKEKEEKELKNLRFEKDVWKFINKKKGKKVQVENNIGKEDWRRHFMYLLGGEESKEGNNKTEDKESNLDNGSGNVEEEENKEQELEG